MKALSNLFPSSKQYERISAFDPTKECIATSQQKKKKSASRGIKPVTVQVILLPKLASLILPKGKKRKLLLSEERILNIHVKRTVSPLELRSMISHAFEQQKISEFEYLEASGGMLVVSTDQSPGGTIVDRRGALYIREKEPNKVQNHAVIALSTLFVVVFFISKTILVIPVFHPTML